MIFFQSTSCDNQHKSKNDDSTLKDSVINNYVDLLSISPSTDTSDIKYKLLKALKSNDTLFLKQAINDIKQAKMIQIESKNSDTLIKKIDFIKLNVSEGYNFIYTGTFCPFVSCFLITKNNEIFNLHVTIYQHDSQNTYGRIVSEYDKKLTETIWAEFKEKLFYSDFWALNFSNDVIDSHRDGLQVTGFRSNNPRTHFPEGKTISRARPRKQAIFLPFEFLLKLSGDKKTCDYASSY